MRNLLNRPFLSVTMLVLTMVLLGTVGYMIIEGWSFIDALYMTAITMSTIGYGEVRSLSPIGRLYTIGLIAVGVVTASFAITVVVELFTSREFLAQLRANRRQRALKKICNHTIICGFGRLGRNLARELNARNLPLIVVDVDEKVVEECQGRQVPVILGNAADEKVLQDAGIERAKALVAAAQSDAENVFIVLTARGINPNLKIITRCNSDGSTPKLEKAGADSVISPYMTTGRRIAQMLIHPNVVSFLDGILEFGDHQMRLEEFIINENSPLAGLTLQEAKLKVAVLAVTHPDKSQLNHPNANTKLVPGAAIIVMGIDEELNNLMAKIEGSSQ